MKAIKAYDADTIIAGHVSRLGKKGDIENQIELFDDIKDGAIKGLSTANMMPLDGAKRDRLPQEARIWVTLGSI